jgi:hypothetical protein
MVEVRAFNADIFDPHMSDAELSAALDKLLGPPPSLPQSPSQKWIEDQFEKHLQKKLGKDYTPLLEKGYVIETEAELYYQNHPTPSEQVLTAAAAAAHKRIKELSAALKEAEDALEAETLTLERVQALNAENVAHVHRLERENHALTQENRVLNGEIQLLNEKIEDNFQRLEKK